MDMEKWHARTAEEAVQFWLTNPLDGLSTQEVKTRLDKFGYNELTEKKNTLVEALYCPVSRFHGAGAAGRYTNFCIFWESIRTLSRYWQLY